MIKDFFTKRKNKFSGCVPRKYPTTLKKEMRYIYSIFQILKTLKSEEADWKPYEDVKNEIAAELDHLFYVMRSERHNIPSSQLLPKIHAVLISETS